MAKIFSIPDEVKAPTFNFKDIKGSQEDEKRFMTEIEAFTKNYNPDGGEHIGKTIKFPVADSCAVYMVASMKPLQLIHLPVGDAWTYPMDTRLRTKDVELKLKQQASLDKMFEENRLKQLTKKI